MSRFAMVSFNDVPPHGTSCKYSVLGRLGLINHAQYCRRHGYRFIGHADVNRSRPACWAKLPALLAALEHHEWVLWADSDTLVFDMERPLESFCDSGHDLVVQCQEHWWERIGLRDGTEKVPMNSGVFLIRATPWSRRFLEDAYAQTQYVDDSKVWNRIGDQEAMNHVILSDPAHRRHIRYAMGLQTSPLYYQPGDFLVHFYGNHLQHRLSRRECAEVLARWKAAVRDGAALPDDLKRFHWACAQNRSTRLRPVRGDLPLFFYTEQDLEPRAAEVGDTHGAGGPASAGVQAGP